MKKIIYILALSITITAYDKLEDVKHPTLEGTYIGTFRKLNESNITMIEDAEIIFKNGTYEVTKANVGKGATGSFTFSDENIINFSDTKIWQQVIDMNLILNSRFRYEVKEDSLILTKDFPLPVTSSKPYFYQYRLKRIAN